MLPKTLQRFFLSLVFVPAFITFIGCDDKKSPTVIEQPAMSPQDQAAYEESMK